MRGGASATAPVLSVITLPLHRHKRNHPFPSPLSPNTFNRIRRPVNRTLITLHNLLHTRPHITQPNINPSIPNPRIRRVLHRLQKILKLRVEGYSESAVYYTTVYLSTEIYFTYVAVIKDCVVAVVGSVMSGDVVDTAACGKSYASFEAFFLY